VLIEAYTYRLGHHTTADDATKYRNEAELKEWEAKDPLKRFQVYLKDKGLWNENIEKAVQEETAADVEKAVAEAEGAPPPPPEDAFRYTYKQMTPQLQEQLDEAKAGAGEGRS
jgi:pyruvate dehydrogenase E1 component alpha subunit